MRRVSLHPWNRPGRLLNPDLIESADRFEKLLERLIRVGFIEDEERITAEQIAGKQIAGKQIAGKRIVGRGIVGRGIAGRGIYVLTAGFM